MKFVNIAIDNNNDNTDFLYTYGCENDEIKVGDKVYVPFAKGNKLKVGYVFGVHEKLTEEINGLKYVDSIDEEISLNQEMTETAAWMKKRYLCRYIEGINCFTPSGSPSKKGKKRIPVQKYTDDSENIKELTVEQQIAMAEIQPYIEKNRHEIFLIHGITGSGKTELYIRLIAKTLEIGKNAIVMVPEISLTPQIIQRFSAKFGEENIAILHSKLSMGERYDEWMRIKNGEVKIVIGARSAVFAPLENIGIAIMDEEHETSYKSDQNPKYDTVEVALKRVKYYDGILVLGSATPSVVSNYRAEQGIYKKIVMKERYNKVPLPQVEIVDLCKELKAGNKSIFSRELYNQMDACLKEGQQVILFLNRRGYSTFVSCRECGYVMKCPDCGISLTYHKAEDKAVCHYCGKSWQVPKICPDCKGEYIRHFGTGTEKVEEAVGEFFPQYTAQRIDLDAVKKKGSLSKILKSFEKGRTHILIGTQMVAKGLDFKNVGLVGIISADVTLNIPDFRSAEKTFQLVTQASGRAGRGDQKGKVVIQTYSPEHYAILTAAEQNYEEFYKREIILRNAMEYPPFSDLVQVIVVAKSEQICIGAAEYMESQLKKHLGDEFKYCVFKAQPLLSNHKNEHYRYGIMIKVLKGRRGKCLGVIDTLKRNINTAQKKQFTVMVDINPY